MINVKKELDKNQILLIKIPSAEYTKDIADIVKQLDGSIGYVTLNKTFDSLKEEFKKKKIKTDNILFIDAISKTIKNAPEVTEGSFFISSPAALTELSLAIDRLLKHDFKYIVFDSLTNLMIYEKKAPVAKFLSFIINKIRQSKTKAVFYALNIKEQETFIEEAGMFVDKVEKIK